MKRQLFILLIATLLAPAGLMAQKVYKTGSGTATKVILEMTVTSGMPDGAQTSTKKYTDSYTTSNVTNTTFIGGNSTVSDNANATVYQTLEIAPLDVNHATINPTVLGFGATMHWQNAFLRCKGLTYNGRTGWRLPTQRELQMIWIFREVLDAIFIGMGNSNSSALPFSSINSYWSATETAYNYAWDLNFDIGRTVRDTKVATFRVRCVREE